MVIPRNCLSSPGIFPHPGTEIILLLRKPEPLQTQKLGSGSHPDRNNYAQKGKCTNGRQCAPCGIPLQLPLVTSSSESKGCLGMQCC